MLVALCLVPLAYLLGTFPSAGIVTRASGRDIAHEGSGNPGASNTYRLLGWKAGLVVLLMDIAKGAIPTAVGLALDGHRGAWILGLAAVLGHVFPVTRRFRGGRGVATAGGVLIVLFPVLSAAAAALWFFIARVLHKASLASIVCATAFPIAVAAVGWGTLDIVMTSGLAVLVIARHLPNLLRLARGDEPGLRAPGARDDRGDS